MIFETNISDYYKVVQSSDECCYKYILGKLNEANEIYIMAYGTTERNKELIDLIKKIKGKTTLITDLEIEKNNNVNIVDIKDNCFNLDKNSKIIMTEKAAFIGAEQNGFSTGFLTIDSDIVDDIKENLFKNKEENTYIGYEFTKLQIIFMNYYSKVNRIIEDIIKGAFKEDEKGNGFYNSTNAHLKFEDIEWIDKTIDEFYKTIDSIKEKELKKALVDTFNKDNIEALKNICNSNEYINELANLSNENKELRKELSVKAEKEILSLYEKLSIFQEELYGVVEQMIDIKTNS